MSFQRVKNFDAAWKGYEKYDDDDDADDNTKFEIKFQQNKESEITRVTLKEVREAKSNENFKDDFLTGYQEGLKAQNEKTYDANYDPIIYKNKDWQYHVAYVLGYVKSWDDNNDQKIELDNENEKGFFGDAEKSNEVKNEKTPLLQKEKKRSKEKSCTPKDTCIVLYRGNRATFYNNASMLFNNIADTTGLSGLYKKGYPAVSEHLPLCNPQEIPTILSSGTGVITAFVQLIGDIRELRNTKCTCLNIMNLNQSIMRLFGNLVMLGLSITNLVMPQEMLYKIFFNVKMLSNMAIKLTEHLTDQARIRNRNQLPITLARLVLDAACGGFAIAVNMIHDFSNNEEIQNNFPSWWIVPILMVVSMGSDLLFNPQVESRVLAIEGEDQDEADLGIIEEGHTTRDSLSVNK